LLDCVLSHKFSYDHDLGQSFYEELHWNISTY
jgi:hypothetical protein